MTQLQREAICRRLDTIRHAVERLRAHRDVPLGEYLADEDEQWIVERGLQRAAEAVLDVCSQMAAALHLPAPQDYAESVDRMALAGVLPPDFVATFRKMAGFRNVLVHGYLDLDPRIVHATLQEHLDDFLRFARLVAAYLPRV